MAKKKAEITNTTKETQRDPMGFFADAVVGGSGRAIENQEAHGQRELCAASGALLPSSGSEDPAFAAMGVIFGAPVAGDPLFRHATLPSGWKVEARPDHSMWSSLLDADGVKRAAIFYKAAFYDRRATIRVESARGQA